MFRTPTTVAPKDSSRLSTWWRKPRMGGLRDSRLGADLDTEKRAFWDDGYLVVRGAFTAGEMDIVRETIAAHPRMADHAEAAKAASRGEDKPSFATLFVWNDTAGFDLFSKAT